MLSISVFFSPGTGNSSHIGPGLQKSLSEALYRCALTIWVTFSGREYTMRWDEGRKGGHRVETEGRFSMGEEIWLNQYFLSAQPSRIPVLWKEGPSPSPPISKRQLQPAAITLQVSANIGSHGQIHEELKHMWNGFRLTAFFPKLAWPVPKRESETTQP